MQTKILSSSVIKLKKYNPKIFVINDLKILERVKKKFKNKKIIFTNFIKKKVSIIRISQSQLYLELLVSNPTLMMIKKVKKILIANKRIGNLWLELDF